MELTTGSGSTARTSICCCPSRWIFPAYQADMLCSYDVTSVFATRNAQLRAWLAASTVLLALGGAAAVLPSAPRHPAADHPAICQ